MITFHIGRRLTTHVRQARWSCCYVSPKWWRLRRAGMESWEGEMEGSVISILSPCSFLLNVTMVMCEVQVLMWEIRRRYEGHRPVSFPSLPRRYLSLQSFTRHQCDLWSYVVALLLASWKAMPDDMFRYCIDAACLYTKGLLRFCLPTLQLISKWIPVMDRCITMNRPELRS